MNLSKHELNPSVLHILINHQQIQQLFLSDVLHFASSVYVLVMSVLGHTTLSWYLF